MELSREVSKAKEKSKAKRVRGVKSISFSGFLVYIVLPLIPLLVFWFIPMIASFLLSFTDWDYISPTFNVVGAQNYKDILSSDAFWQALKNTLLFGLGTVVPTLIFGFLMAILIDKIRRGKELIQGFLFAPWITPMVAMSIVWSWMFRPDIGLINRGLAIFGISGPNWLTDSNTALIAVMIVTVWEDIGLVHALLR